MAQAEIAELSLVVSVWDFNGGILKDDFIGRIVLGKHPTGNDRAHGQLHSLFVWSVSIYCSVIHLSLFRRSRSSSLEQYASSGTQFGRPVAHATNERRM